MPLNELNTKQLEAVQYNGKYLLVNSGPGSGKTYTLVERTRWLLNNGADPSTILLLTFTNHAAGVMKDRILEELPDIDIHASTFHSFCYGVLREYLPSDRNRFTVADEDDQRKILARLIKGSGSRRTPASAAEYINLRKSNGISSVEDGDDLYILYDEYLLEHNLVDFGGLQLLAMEYIPDIDRYAHILIDEFHDTSPIQMSIVRALEPHSDTITVVCDDQQSIYGWRGADIRNILSFREYYPDTVVVQLERNYRSTKCIVNSINKLISYATEKLEDKRLYSDRKYGREVEYTLCSDTLSEARFVVDSITSNGAPQDHMVLYRTNAQSRAVEEILLSRGIPYRLVAATSFYRRKEIKDVMAYLRWIYNPKDEVALLRICNTPRRGLGKSTIAKLSEEYGDLCTAITGGNAKVAALTNILNDMGSHMSDSVPSIMRRVIQISGYLGMLALDTSQIGLDRISNVDSLISGATEFMNSFKDQSIDNYIKVISLISDSDMHDESSTVKLMTIHASKGMESKYIHIVGACEGILPHKLSIIEGNTEEERRLMYVAVSRGMDEVSITGIQSGYTNGKYVQYSRSRFLGELGI